MTNNNLKMFCLTLEPSHQSIIKEMGYIPVGLGEKIFPENCFSDKQGNKKLVTSDTLKFTIER